MRPESRSTAFPVKTYARMTSLGGSKRSLRGGLGELVIDGLSFCVFAVLDVVDQLLCPVFAFLDSLFDKKLSTCYCRKDDLHEKNSSCILPLLSSAQESVDKKKSIVESWRRISDTVYASRRKAANFRLHLVPLHRVLSSEASTLDTIDIRKSESTTDAAELTVNVNLGGSKHGEKLSRGSVRLKSNSQQRFTWSSFRNSGGKHITRWSDCGCEKCISWQVNEQMLYVHVDNKDFVASLGVDRNLQTAENNVVFLHGFLSSSSFWTDSVIPALPQEVRETHRLFALDILGFGKSPKPSDCFYTLADHVDIIERSLLQTYGIRKFHLVAHSMGCIIALALAARFPAAVKTLTLVAPPYFPSTPGDISGVLAMQQVVPKKIWPLVAFGSAVMSWYEHVGRVVCLVVCKNHRFWEPLLRFLHSKIPGHRIPVSSVANFTQHTHHSAWHLFHNTICSGAHVVDNCFEILLRAGRRIRVIHGTHDSVVPYKQSETLTRRHPDVVLTPVPFANHASIVFGRESKLAMELAEEFKLAGKSIGK